MKLKVQHYFDAAHQLKDSDLLITKACARLHGHTYAVIVEAESDLNEAGMVVDFKAIKQIIDRLDHQYINDIFNELGIEKQPTAENIAVVIADWLADELDIMINKISVCEGYKGIERASWAIYEPR
jgi:6-pyruvoyltetrahydropterin/6-carboxytetrahydropterin synthase